MEENKKNMMKSRLMTKDFCCLCVANFLMFFSFYALMPLLPFYLEDIFAVNHSVTGIVLASYSVACILMRPISGYMLDVFRQRPLFLLGYCLFTILFCGYAFSAVLGTFIVFRVAHGAAFGLTSVSGNTIASEIVPQRRMGEGLGYYGLSNTLAMCVGPMSGLALQGRISYDILFILLFALCFVGFLVACMVTMQGRKPVGHPKFSFKSLFLTEGLWEAISLLFASAPYGMTTAYIALYAKEISIPFNSGTYYTVMALGLGISRLLSGKRIDKGMANTLIIVGLLLVVASYVALSFIRILATGNTPLVAFVCVAIAFLQGISFGTLHPAFNTLLVKMAPAERRGSATSTYQTGWDLGIGIGIVVGGYWADYYGGFHASYFGGACLALLGCIIFVIKMKWKLNHNIKLQ